MLVTFQPQSFNSSFTILYVLLTVSSLDVVTVPTSWLHLQQLHGPVQQAVDHLKTGTLVIVNGAEAPAVPGANIWRV